MQTLLEPQLVARQRSQPPRIGGKSAIVGSDRWEQRFAELLAFKAAHGHCNVPSTSRDDTALARWVFNCRRQRKLGSLDRDRIERLDAIGFVWALRNRRFFARDWDAMLAQLEAFHRDHGHSNVPYSWPQNRELAAWLRGVRGNKRAGRLEADRVRQLDALGVVWDPIQARWENMFAELVEYHRHHGDCNVSRNGSANPALAKWAKGVRAMHKRGSLDSKRIRRLNSIGFAWEHSGEGRWEETYAALVGYHQIHGHCRISTLSEDYPALGNWVRTQRTLRRYGRLEQTRITRLDAIGFTWDDRRERWETMFAVLQEYRRTTGHCDVPLAWSENRRLANWVMTQRAAYKAGRLDGERIERLQAIGFAFSIVGDRILFARPAKTQPAQMPDRRAA